MACIVRVLPLSSTEPICVVPNFSSSSLVRDLKTRVWELTTQWDANTHEFTLLSLGGVALEDGAVLFDVIACDENGIVDVQLAVQARQRGDIIPRLLDGRLRPKELDELDRADRDIALAAIATGTRDALSLVSTALQNDRGVVMASVQKYGESLEWASTELQGDPAVVLAAVTQNGMAIRYAEGVLWRDHRIMLQVAVMNLLEFEDDDDEDIMYLRSSREFMLQLVARDGFALRLAIETLLEDRELVLAAVRQAGRALSYAPDVLRSDVDVVKVAVYNDGRALEFASEDLHADEEIVRIAVSQDGDALMYAAPCLLSDRAFLLSVIEQCTSSWRKIDIDIIGPAADNLKNDREFVMAALAVDGTGLRFVGHDLKSDREVVKVALRNDPSSIAYASPTARSDDELLKEAVAGSGLLLRHCTEALRSEFDMVTNAVRDNPGAFKYVAPSLQTHPEVIRSVILHGIDGLKHVAPRHGVESEAVWTRSSPDRLFYVEMLPDMPHTKVCGDRELVLAAVQHSGFNLKHAAEHLRGDREIVRAAISQSALAMHYASEELQCEREFVLTAALGGVPWRKEVHAAFCDDVEIVQAFAQHTGSAFAFAAESLRSDPAVIMRFLNLNISFSYECVAEPARSDRDVVIAFYQRAYKQPSLSLVPDSLRGDRELVTLALAGRSNDSDFLYADEGLRCDREFVLSVLQASVNRCNQPKSFDLFDESLRSDRSVALEALRLSAWYILFASEGLRSDRGFVLESVSLQPDCLEYLSETLKADPAVVLAARSALEMG